MTGDIASEQPLHGWHPMQGTMTGKVRTNRIQASRSGCRRAFCVCDCRIHEGSNECFSSTTFCVLVSTRRKAAETQINGCGLE